MPGKTELIILQGSYTVINRKTTVNTTIVSPSVQCCIVVALNSTAGVALAHIDQAAVKSGAAALKAMIVELRQMGGENITAELIGGDFGDPLMNSSLLHCALISELQAARIPHVYRIWNLDPSFAIAVTGVLASCLFLCGSNNLVVFIPVFMAMLMLYLSVKLMMGSSHDVAMDVASGQITSYKSNTQHTLRILEEAEKNLPECQKIHQRWQQGLGNSATYLIRVADTNLPRQQKNYINSSNYDQAFFNARVTALETQSPGEVFQNHI